MKKILISLSVLLILILLSGCNDNIDINTDINTDSVIYKNSSYSPIYGEWYPYGIEIKKGEWIEFDNDEENIFIKPVVNLSNLVYHKDANNFPNYQNIHTVEKITLKMDKKEVTLYDDIEKIINYMNFDKININDIDDADLSSNFIFVNIYFHNYPAYQSKWMICKTKSGNFGIRFSNEDENTNTLGKNKAIVITDESLIKTLLDI